MMTNMGAWESGHDKTLGGYLHALVTDGLRCGYTAWIIDARPRMTAEQALHFYSEKQLALPSVFNPLTERLEIGVSSIGGPARWLFDVEIDFVEDSNA